jgi:hypothetical protein
MLQIKRYERCESRDIDMEYIVKLIDKNIFMLPDSQREKEWVPEQDLHFIKSVFENKPLGSIILNKKSDKIYVLDGQHRIDSIKKFYKNEIKLNGFDFNELDEDWKKIFLETKIYIKEYENLSDKDMKNIIISINEGIKNDNINNNKDTEQILENFYIDITKIIFPNLKDIKTTNKEEIKKYVGYIGTIINNIDNYKSNSDYKLLSIKHSTRYNNLLGTLDFEQIEKSINLIKNYIKFLFENKLINIDDDINNNVLNTILYKIYHKFNKINKDDINNVELERIKIKKLVDNYSKNKFRDLLELYDSI